MKKIICMVIAVIAVFSMFKLSVVATDYGVPPEYTIIPVGTAVTAADILAALEADEPVIDISDGDVFLSKAALAEIAKGGKVVTFLENGCSITIDPADISDKARAIILNVDVEHVEQINGIEAESILITPRTRGEYGFALTISINPDFVAATRLDTENLSVYYIATHGEIADYYEPVKVSEENAVSIKIWGSSSYAITNTDLLAVANDAAENTANAEDTAYAEDTEEAEDLVVSNSGTSDVAETSVVSTTPTIPIDPTVNEAEREPSMIWWILVAVAGLGIAGVVGVTAVAKS